MYTAYWNRIKSAIGEPAGTTFCSGFLEQEHRSRNVTDKALKKTIPNLLRILKQLDLLFVEKIFAANLIERGQAVGPACNDFFGSNTGLHLMDAPPHRCPLYSPAIGMNGCPVKCTPGRLRAFSAAATSSPFIHGAPNSSKGACVPRPTETPALWRISIPG